ncbi:hypothetical protein LJC21_02870 [Bacteroides sp. OttesenSCG-928-E20]|nr:hypothetical protein [Bacteroides sp. OttesenSCG-928-E20]MDL2306246.1 hypothetical protein [Bacteroides sp. OttesenSCG-928-D19]
MFKPKQLTLILATALLLGACGNNDDLLPDVDNPQQQVPLPIITAQIGGEDDTRAGVVTDNENYAKGERFRWNTNDKVTMYFYQGDDAKYTVTYVAASIDATNPNLCTFTPKEDDTVTSIAEGMYEVVGLYAITFTAPTENNMGNLRQAGNNSSSHLSGQLPMKGKAVLNASATAAPTALSMRFNHLSSVVRYVVTNNAGNADLKVSSIDLTSSTAPFAVRTYLFDKDAQALTLSSKGVHNILSVTDGAFSATDNTFHGFTRVVTGSEAITDLTVYVTLNNNDKPTLLSYIIPPASLTNVLGQGFKPGHSYYFRLNINSAGLVVSSISEWAGTEDKAIEGELYTRYSVGDYYPNPTPFAPSFHSNLFLAI